MQRKVNIIRFLAMLLLLVAVSFTLSGCDKDGAVPEGTNSEELAKEHRDCWQKPMLTVLYDTMGSVAMGMYTKITQGALTLMLTAFAVWFAFRLLKFVSSFKDAAGESAEMWNEVLRKLVLCFICGWLASSVDGLLWVLNMIIFPIYNAFLEFGSKVLEVTSSTDTTGQNTVTVFGETITGGYSVVCRAAGTMKASLSGFPSAPREMMECMICAVNERLTLGNSLAFEVMKMPGFMATVVGLIVLVSFTVIKLGFVFYLVDTIFKFTLMIVMLPILVMSYAFDQTKKWAITGFKSILNSAAFMMMIAILISMALLAVMQILQDHPEVFNPTGEQKEAFREFSPAVLALLLVAFLIKNTLSVAQKMVSAIIGGESAKANFQRKLAALVKMVGKGILAWMTAGASKGLEAVKQIEQVQKGIEKAKKSHVGKAVIATRNTYRNAKEKYTAFQRKMDSLAGKK